MKRLMAKAVWFGAVSALAACGSPGNPQSETRALSTSDHSDYTVSYQSQNTAYALATADGLLDDTVAVHGSYLTTTKGAVLEPSLRHDPSQLKGPQRDPGSLRLSSGAKLAVQGTENLATTLNNDFTLELWVRLSKAQDQPVATIGGQAKLAVRQGQLALDVGGRRVDAINIVADEWFHVVVQRKGRTFGYYVNGYLLDSSEFSGTLSGQILLGSRDALGAFDGKFENFRLISEALYGHQFTLTNDFVNSDKLVVGYDFDGLPATVTKVPNLSQTVAGHAGSLEGLFEIDGAGLIAR